MNKRILVLSTHPDDAVLGLGAYMARCIREGDQVKVITFCVGGPCSNVSKEIRKDEDQLAMIRLGVSDYEYHEGELDGRLEMIPSPSLTGFIDKKVSEFRPTHLFISPNSQHSDHQALFKAAIASCRLRSGWTIPNVYEMTYQFSDTITSIQEGSQVFLPASEKDLNTKLEAFQEYKSQCKPSPSPLGVDGIKTQMAYFGLSCGHQYAEKVYAFKEVM